MDDTWCRVVVDGETVAFIRLPVDVSKLAYAAKVWPGGVITPTKPLTGCLQEMQGIGEQLTVEVDGHPIRVRPVLIPKGVPDHGEST